MIFTQILVSALMALNLVLSNLGWTVVAMTVIIKLLLLPLVLPSIKSAGKMRQLQPKLQQLTKKYGGDKQKLAQEQMKLYKSVGVNPMSGCLPQILQIAVLILFYSSFQKLISFSTGGIGVDELNKFLFDGLKVTEGFKMNTNFLGTDLAVTPSSVISSGVIVNMILPLVLLVGSGALQFWGAKLTMPDIKGSDETAYTKATPEKGDDMQAALRNQSLYMMPLMTIFIGFKFSVGILLYWFINSAMVVVQQMLVGKGKS